MPNKRVLTDKQKEVLEQIILHLEYYKDTNDYESPSLCSALEFELSDLDLDDDLSRKLLNNYIDIQENILEVKE